MKKLLFLFATMALVGGVILFSCSESAERKAGEIKELTPEQIGELHNVLLQRVIDDFFPTMQRSMATRSGEEFAEQSVIDVSGLMEFIAEQPEMCDMIDDDIVAQAKELLLGFNDSGQDFTLEGFFTYLDGKVIELYGVSALEIIGDGEIVETRATVDRESLENARRYGNAMYKASAEFWARYFNKSMTTRNGDMEELIDEPIDEAEARWINITLIDAVGMIAGNYFFPGYGGYIGVGASAIAEEIDRLPPVGPVPPGPPIDYEPWTCNPKFI